MADWKSIQTEYITTQISQRDLAKKHGVSLAQLSRHSRAEGWVHAREQHDHNTITRAINKAGKIDVDYRSELYKLAHAAVQQMNDILSNNTLQELLDRGIRVRDITGAIKDLEDALHVKSEKDIKEQEARIKKLQRDAEFGRSDGDQTAYGVLIMPAVRSDLTPPGDDDGG